MAKAKKELDTELNLMAFISLLSVLICSLLLTAIWVQIGTMDVKQAVGGQTKIDNTKLPSVWAMLNADGSLKFQLRDIPSKARRLNNHRIKGIDGKINVTAFVKYVEALKRQVPDMRTALIKPKADAVYEEIIVLMDQFKKNGLIDLGVAPL